MKIDKRNMATSDAYFVTNNSAAWTDWKITDAVADGYKSNPWVYRAIRLITQSASTVPWVVFDKEMSPLWDHPLSLLFAKPNPHLTRQQVFEMVVSWLELAGNGYFKKVILRGRTVELWPISPDRLAPIPSKDPTLFIDGYIRKADGGGDIRDPEYNAQTVIHIRFIDPANPYLGIAPLSAAARTVDLDNSQLDWNTSTMQNRGVVDGVFTFKRPLDAPQSKNIMERIMEKFSGKKNARKPLVIGEDAMYTRLSLSPTELDFLESRKDNRLEILSVYGVPPQLAGVQESSTFNNFTVSRRVFWETTILPLLDTMKDAFNHSFSDELAPGLTLGYDTSDVAALKDNEIEKAKVGKVYHSMGVPVSVLNDKLSLGLDEYDGWDESGSEAPPPGAPPDPPDDDTEGARSFELVPLEQRSVDSEIKLRDRLVEKFAASLYAQFLAEQGTAVFNAIEAGRDPVVTAASYDSELTDVIEEVYITVALEMAKTVARPRRSNWFLIELRENTPYEEELLATIKASLQDELIILKEKSFIQEATAQFIIDQTAYGVANGWPPSKIQQAIVDTGAFSPERALRIARTTAGAATGVGQLAAGSTSGATHKKWLTSVANVRDAHVARDGEVVPIDNRFSSQVGGQGPRYPCDPSVAAADRINCRCFMSFEFRVAATTPATTPAPVNTSEAALLAAKKAKKKAANSAAWAKKKAANAAAKAAQKAALAEAAAKKAAADAAAKAAQLAAAKANVPAQLTPRQAATLKVRPRSFDRVKQVVPHSQIADEVIKTSSDKQLKALESYKGGGYSQINKYLRKNTAVQSSSIDEAETLKELFKTNKFTTLQSDAVLYRGVNKQALDAMGIDPNDFDDLIGAELTDRGIISSSFDKQVAANFGSQDGALFIIEGKAGDPGLFIDKMGLGNHSGEAELIFPPGSFVIKSASMEAYDTYGYSKVLTIRIGAFRPL